MASKKPSGLGRGLGALLGDDVLQTESTGSLSLPISQVESCSSQPRKSFDEASLAELADSIREHGIIQPLTVRKLASGYYQIIAGERRWRAARIAGLQEVPVIVIEADDRKAAELAMIENLQREDLNPMEEAAGFQSLIETYHMTQEEAAKQVGKSRSAVTNSLRLLSLTPAVRQLVEEGKLSAGHARALLPLSPAMQENAANAVVAALGIGRTLQDTVHYSFDTNVYVVIGKDWRTVLAARNETVDEDGNIVPLSQKDVSATSSDEPNSSASSDSDVDAEGSAAAANSAA